MDMLQNVLGSLGGDQQDKLRDFSRRYQDGRPDQGYSDDEARQSYDQLAGRLPAREYESSAEEAFARLSPDERRQFGEWLQQRTGGRFPTAGTDDPHDLARAASQAREEQPNLLQQAFGEGGMLSNPIAKMAVAGIAAMAAQRMFGNKN
jgi:hypothetical protein